MSPSQAKGFERERSMRGAPIPAKPDTEVLRRHVGEVGERMAAQAAAVSRAPTYESAMRLALNHEGAAHLARQLAASLVGEIRTDV